MNIFLKNVKTAGLVMILLIQFLPFAKAQQNQKSLPNIIIILADDMGSGDVSSYNPASKIQTPNIDRLVAEGMRFTDAHSSASVCTPSRYSILTGQYCWRSTLKKGVLGAKSGPIIPPTRLTLASMLGKRGYHSACIGKWHLGLNWKDKNDWSKGYTGGPTAVGFDYFYGIPASLDMADYAYLEYDAPVQTPTIPVEDSPLPVMWRGGLRSPDFKHIEVLPKLTNKSVDYITQRSKNSDKPFFLYLSLTAPHTPHIVPDSIENTPIKGVSQAGERGDMVYITDWAVGKVLQTLDDLEIADNTIVIFTSDNGAHDFTYRKTGHTPHLNYRGQKADIYEGGHRIPLVARWPGVVKPKTVSTETVCLVDLMATFAAITGYVLPNNAGEDSYSLLPILLERPYQAPLREATVHHSNSGLFALRVGKWKFTPDDMGSGGFTNPKSKSGSGTLYNLDKDISETINRYDKSPVDVKNFRALLKKYQNEGRSTPLPRNDELWFTGTFFDSGK